MGRDEIEKLITDKQAEDTQKREQETSMVKETAVVPSETNRKAISEVGLSDIQIALDKDKSYEEQAEDVVGAMATAGAVTDEGTKQTLIDQKSEELKAKAEAKVKKAQSAVAEAETNVQKAERELNDGVLETFGITKHLPKPLMKVIMLILGISYVFYTIIIRVPMGGVRIFIDTLDGIFVRYERVDSNIKPRIKVIGWIILGLITAGIICLTVLKILNKI